MNQLKLSNVDVTCRSCPLQFDALIVDRPVYFRYRNGSWYLCYIDRGEMIAQGGMIGEYDGSASFKEVRKTLKLHEVKLPRKEEW